MEGFTADYGRRQRSQFPGSKGGALSHCGPPLPPPAACWKRAARVNAFLRLFLFLIVLVLAFQKDVLASNRRRGPVRTKGGSGFMSVFKKKPDYFPQVKDPEEKRLLNESLIALLKYEGVGSETFELKTENYGVVIEISLSSIGLNWPEYDMIGELTKELQSTLEELKELAAKEPGSRHDRMLVRDNGRFPPYRSRVILKMSGEALACMVLAQDRVKKRRCIVCTAVRQKVPGERPRARPR
ncbi:hypothetical protein Efla_007610 [Eimeria flavescens]